MVRVSLAIVLISVVHAAWAAENQLSDTEVAEGWILLFDGTSDKGWITSNGGRTQRPIENGLLNPHKCGAYMLVTEQDWNDYVLTLDFKQSPGCNSGVFFRVYSLTPQLGKDVGYNGIEIAIDDKNTAGYHDAGAIYDLSPPRKNVLRPIGEWNHLKLNNRNNRAIVELNGELVNDVDFDQFVNPGERPDGTKHKFGIAFKDFPRQGRIGLQDHGSDIWFKNIKLLPLHGPDQPPSGKKHCSSRGKAD
jgi:hypothetical protein